MATPTILLFGSLQHPTLSTLYQFLHDRGRRRVVYLANEHFPYKPKFFLRLSQDGYSGHLVLEDESLLDLEEVKATGLDGYYVNPAGLDQFSPQDQHYLQTESWATLIALFHGLADRGPVANHVLDRELLSSRASLMALLGRAGVPTVPLKLTSDPDDAREFFHRNHAGRLLSRPIVGLETAFQVVDPQAEERLDRLPLCPVHFEADLPGQDSTLYKIGSEWWSGEEKPPASQLAGLTEVCDRLGLHLAQCSWRHQDGQWWCVDLKCFPGPGVFTDPERAERLAVFFEEGA